MKTRILCLGNELVVTMVLGFGGRILASLLSRRRCGSIHTHLGFDLLEAVQESERLIWSMHAYRPQPGPASPQRCGIERYARARQFLTRWASPSYQAGAAPSAGLAPGFHLFVGIEGQAFDEYGIDLTPRSAKPFPRLSRKSFARSGRAKRYSHRQPTPARSIWIRRSQHPAGEPGVVSDTGAPGWGFTHRNR